MLVSAQEPPSLKALGTVSSRCEEYGADFLISSPLGLIGVQRKGLSDLAASYYDDRVSREIILLKELDYAAWIIEGIPQFSSDGESMWTRTPYTRSQHLGLLFTLSLEGFLLFSTTTTTESGLLLLQLEKWVNKEKHSGMNHRASPRGEFGKADTKEWQIHFLQGLPGMGYERAKDIVEECGGLPLKLTRDLTEIKGIGKKTTERIERIFDTSQESH